MFIVWGKKHVHSKMGFAADFCPLCRCVRTFQVNRLGLASHIYYVSFGQGKLVGYSRKCTTCKTVLSANPDLYKAISKSSHELAALRRATFPSLETHYAERLQLEQKIKQSPSSISSAERLALIKEPFVLLNPLVEKRFESTFIDWQTGLALLGLLILFPMAFQAVRSLFSDYEGELIMGFTGLALVVLVAQGIGQGNRYFKRSIFPVLVPTLQPLRPTKEELSAVHAELKKARTKFGKKMKLESLWEGFAQKGGR